MGDRASYINYFYWIGYSTLVVVMFQFLMFVFRACDHLSDKITSKYEADKAKKKTAAIAKRKVGVGWWT